LPGKNPSQAYHKFIGPLQQSVSCITHDVLIVSTGGRHVEGDVHSVTLPGGPILLNDDGAQLSVALQYSIIKTDQPGMGPYKVSTHAYDYALLDAYGDTMIAHHWHPYGASSHNEPHFHVHAATGTGMSHKQHHPSGRMSLEQVVRFCIQEMGAQPLRDDWDKILGFNEGRFKLYRSWSDIVPTSD
jgi:hypothetical protein